MSYVCIRFCVAGDSQYTCCSGETECQREDFHVTESRYDDMEGVVETVPSEGKKKPLEIKDSCDAYQ